MMLRHLVVLYLALFSILMIDHNPLWALPLLLVSGSFIWNNRWLGLTGIALFLTITVGRLPALYLSDLRDMAMLAVTLLIPSIIAIELVLTRRPYDLRAPGLKPFAITAILAVMTVIALVAIPRLLRIGIYMGSDPGLQVFFAISASLLFTAPVLLSRGGVRERR
ncbi:MAG: hypothetical protein QCI82_06615 [Candidatus Thermoplasmatota archaeon]|nr:hypothetical protein [Candidatus Thermoplasmatota archaeon]